MNFKVYEAFTSSWCWSVAMVEPDRGPTGFVLTFDIIFKGIPNIQGFFWYDLKLSSRLIKNFAGSLVNPSLQICTLISKCK